MSIFFILLGITFCIMHFNGMNQDVGDDDGFFFGAILIFMGLILL